MAESKIYLAVPYAQKDEAKALGARWDAGQKKWYVSADKDIGLFAKWPVLSEKPEPSQMSATRSSPVQAGNGNDFAVQGVMTRATVKDFVAYNGDAPPWD